MSKLLLCGDIGGTKTIVQLIEWSDDRFQSRYKYRYDSVGYATFSEILVDFLRRADCKYRIHTACFAVAGPVVAQQTRLTNLPWYINSEDIAREFSIPTVQLVNDFEAAALAVEDLPAQDLVMLQAGQRHAQAMRVILGAGTGMGVAWLTWSNGRYVALPTEAGHMDFAPTTALQIELLESLQQKFGHVSVERVLSGTGITDIFNFLWVRAPSLLGLPPIELTEDSGATVAALAQIEKHPIAIHALDLFAEIYGAYAGSLALAGLCHGGVYIAGGIAPKIIETLGMGGFMRAFRTKGRFSAVMYGIPVYVVTNTEISLLGARNAAHNLLIGN